jgi:alpha-glucoside transport system permease protein
MWLAFRNNIIWLVVGTGGSVGIGLAVAALFDRVKREALAKAFVFLPLAISMVGAAVIWRFMYAWQPAGEQQIGLVNAVVQGLGGTPRVWIQIFEPLPLNTLLLIVIMIWLQTGFAMVVLSAALKGVSAEVIEAARMDGAGERQVFFQIVIPIIRGTIIAVATTVAIAILKVFDIVYVMTGGNHETEVMANRMFSEMFVFGNFGRAAAIATILFLAVVPIMIVNIRNLRRQGIGR